MTPPSDDLLAQRLAGLPDAPLDPGISAAVLRKARGALEEDPAVRLSRLWTGAVLPALLVGCAMAYAVSSAEFLERIYVASAGRWPSGADAPLAEPAGALAPRDPRHKWEGGETRWPSSDAPPAGP